VLSDSEKKIGAAFSFSEAPVGFCGFWVSIEAMDAPSTLFSDAVFSGFTGGNVVSVVVASAGVIGLASGFVEAGGFADPVACAAMGAFAETCGTGMIAVCGTGMTAVCGLTTSRGFGAGVTSRIEASPAVAAVAVPRIGVGTATAACGVEWDTACADASFASTRSLF